MAQTLIYISKSGDKDLLGLLNHIGMKSFRKVVRHCMHALSDTAYVNIAKETVRNANDGENHATESSFGVGIKIRVQLDPFSQKLLDELEAGSTSMFVKTTVRQVLGPQLLLPYLIKANSNVQIQEVPFVSLINIGQVVQIKKERTSKPSKRKVTRSATSSINIVPDQSAAEPIQIQEESARATDAPSFSAPDSPSFTGPSFDVPAHNIENVDPSPASASNDDDFDILSMLEAML